MLGTSCAGFSALPKLKSKAAGGGARGTPSLGPCRVHEPLVPVVIVIMIMIMVVIIVMAVAPVPVLFLVVLVQSAKVAVVTMIFDHPLTVVDSFVIVPAMIVVVIGIIDTIGSGCTASGHRWCEECDGQEQRTETPGCTVHNVVPPGQCSFVFRDFGATEDLRVAWPISIGRSEQADLWIVVGAYLPHSGRVKVWSVFHHLAP